jgi:hypothetical protein
MSGIARPRGKAMNNPSWPGAISEITARQYLECHFPDGKLAGSAAINSA